MTARDDLDRKLDALLRDGPTELPSESFVAVRKRIDQTRQRVVVGPWRFPDMHKLVPIGLGAAAVVLVLVAGTQLLGRPSSAGVGSAPTASPSPTPSPTTGAAATPIVDGSLPVGPIVVTGTDDPVQVTLDIAASGWFSLRDFDAVTKDDDSLDPPETVGAALLAWAWPAGTGINVYRDPCQWSTTIPETPATTPEEIATAFAAQSLSEPTAPMDVTVGGYAGKAITLSVPMTYDLPNATREERFADCDSDMFVYYGVDGPGGDEPARNAQGAGQVDELWILDVGGSIVILDTTYSPATPPALVEEARALAESATFE